MVFQGDGYRRRGWACPAFAACAVLAVGAAACGGSPAPQASTSSVAGSAGPTTSTSLGSTAETIGPSSTQTADTTPSTVEAGPVDEVTTATVGSLGTVLVNGQGLTLYLFLPDDHSSRSTCYQECAVGWPPLLLTEGTGAPMAGRGIDPALLSTATRTGGGVQVVYNGWPLYRWYNDTRPGVALGQGLDNLGGLWYVLNAQGNPVKS